jgi:hypothetical protein
MTNTSATGGYLTPTDVIADDQALRRILHGFIVGLTGLAAEKVRPAWQGNMPAIEDNGVNWCAYAVGNFEAGQAYQVHVDADEQTEMKQCETFDLSCSFYGANCERYCGLVRDGLQVAQNREAMWLQGISVTNAPKITHVPELVNTVWQDRCDIVIAMGREYTRRYDILSFLSAYGDVITDTDITQPWVTAGIFDYTFDATFQ